MTSLQQTDAAMHELIKVGGVPNGKLAYYNAVLSIQNSVANNAEQALVMRQYVNAPLPVNKEQLRQELKAVTHGVLSHGLLSTTLDTLYRIEHLWNVGQINFNCGYTFEDQCSWRRITVAAIKGMGYKTVSFALHIYAPDICQLLTIDRWHIYRYTGEFNKGLTPNQYIELEQRLYDDIELLKYDTGIVNLWPITYAAYLWECTRQANTQFPDKQYELDGSYSKLSCYI